LYAQATERGKAMMGSSHPHVQEWKASYEKFNKKKTAVKNVTKGSSNKNERSSRNLVVWGRYEQSVSTNVLGCNKIAFAAVSGFLV
jgi:hypothetical protein